MGMERINKKLHIARRGVVYSLVLCFLILLIGGVGFWMLDPGVNTLADGLWLAFTTAATVGYGDVVPSTHASRTLEATAAQSGRSAAGSDSSSPPATLTYTS